MLTPKMPELSAVSYCYGDRLGLKCLSPCASLDVGIVLQKGVHSLCMSTLRSYNAAAT